MIESIAFRLRPPSSSRNTFNSVAHTGLKRRAISTNRLAFGLEILSNSDMANLVTCGLAAPLTNSPYTSPSEFSRNPAVRTQRYLPQWPISSISPLVAVSVRSSNDVRESSCAASFLFRMPIWRRSARRPSSCAFSRTVHPLWNGTPFPCI